MSSKTYFAWGGKDNIITSYDNISYGLALRHKLKLDLLRMSECSAYFLHWAAAEYNVHWSVVWVQSLYFAWELHSKEKTCKWKPYLVELYRKGGSNDTVLEYDRKS